MAGVARLRESGGDVVRDVAAQGLRVGPIRGVAGIASGAGQVVIVTGVALRATRNLASGRQLVAAGKRPASDRVVKGIVSPRDCVVAGGAIRCREGSTGRRVRRIIGLLPSRQVATGIAAIRRLNAEVVVAADVALAAGRNLSSRRHLVGVGQREARGTVIKLTIGPGGDRVAGRARRRGGREIGRDVIGYVAAESLRAVPGGLVAAHAIGRGQIVVVVNVALCARRGGMGASQRKSGDAVIEAGLVGPGDGVVAA